MAYAHRAARWATQSEKTHHTVSHMTRSSTEYFRLNVEHGLGKLKLDAWKGKKGCETLDLICTKTQEYLDTTEGQQQIADSARQLVSIRKARSSQTYIDRWERFCHGVYYACCVAACPEGRDERYRYRQTLQRHIQDHHPLQCNRLESLLNEGRRLPDETEPEQ